MNLASPRRLLVACVALVAVALLVAYAQRSSSATTIGKQAALKDGTELCLDQVSAVAMLRAITASDRVGFGTLLQNEQCVELQQGTSVLVVDYLTLKSQQDRATPMAEVRVLDGSYAGASGYVIRSVLP